ncbi:ABC transporter permease subunit [Sediminispirochaeta smaragdinae]|jgi:simple sugar transport system permease protein|uniref:Inner-membrane translocator n=1 Tax=Sediminispirochaeta smaragdinae (strain DSM 11293 / JCM 15392 / SEBR 4228) TaxID=573413 RepID=E1R2E7_SEDSS|nr:ABC transporter permease [Sediminispirochaeta smaragdinae]ADK82507.1 inner-membrane translocator [Sediminispirochaeta smaragdinae DSM 11293]
MNILGIAKRKISGTSFLLVITIVMFIIMYFAGVLIYHEQGFGKMQTLMNMLIDNAGLIIAAAGMTIVIITGGIDISIGSVIGLVCMMLADMMQNHGMNAWLSIGLVLLFGVFFGIVQGWLIAYLKLQPFIVTLAGMFFCRGMTAMISVNQIAITGNQTFLDMATKNIYLFFGATVNKRGIKLYPFIHPSVIIALVALIAVWYILRYTKFGRGVFAIGGSEQSALLMGLNVRRIKMRAYVLNGFLAALAGFVFCLNTTSGFVEQARGFEMEAIASTVIGGTLLTGGVGTAIGSFFGVMIKATIETYIRSNGTLSSWWNKIVLSALLCFFIVLQSIFASLKSRRRI